MTKKISSKDVAHLAKLANLPLSKQQLKSFSQELSAILKHVQKIDSIDFDTSKTTNQVTSKTNQFRVDAKKPSLTQKEALSQAKKTHQGYFIVPALIKHE